MHPIIRNILGVIAGCFVGMIVNFAILKLGNGIVPPPDGVDPNDINSMKANIHLYEMKHFLVPFLAHAGMALFGGFIAARIAASYQMVMALIVGLFSLFGGMAMVMMLPEAPTWFKASDILLAYLPMAFLGGKIAGGNRPPPIKRGTTQRDDILDQA